MNARWFKDRQKRLGITVHKLGEALGKDRTVVSRIYSERQKMTLEEAQVFAELLEAPLHEVLVNAGLTPSSGSKSLASTHPMGDAAPWLGDPPTRIANSIEEISGSDIWRVSSDAMALAGVLPGDFIMVDTRIETPPQSGKLVLAQVYDVLSGISQTLLRRLEHRVLIASSQRPEHERVFVVDGNAVVVKGVITDCWRSYV